MHTHVYQYIYVIFSLDTSQAALLHAVQLSNSLCCTTSDTV
jgi:hypothetical protein